MNRAISVFLFLLFFCFLITPARADTPLDVLGVEKTVNDLGHQAQVTGDVVAKAFADQAIRVIKAWEKANSGLINQAFDRLDKQSQALFREINDTATRLERGESVTFLDLQRTMVTAGSVVAELPGSSDTPQVVFYWPTILLPVGDPKVTINVIGPGVADANPTVMFSGHEIPVNKLSDNEISFGVDRGAIPSKPDESSRSVFSLTYKVSMSHWYNPFSWWSTSPRDRDIEVTMLPKTPGVAVITPLLHTGTWESKVLGPILIGGRGHDAPYRVTWSLEPLLQEKGWILDKEAQERNASHFDDNYGDGDGGSHCVGYDPNSFTDTSLQFLIQHGHKTDAFGHHTDAHQNCRIWIYLKRLVTADHDGVPMTKALNWATDTVIQLPDNTLSYRISLSLYTGKSYSIDNDSQIPYSLFEVFRQPNSINFRPRPQRDF